MTSDNSDVDYTPSLGEVDSLLTAPDIDRELYQQRPTPNDYYGKIRHRINTPMQKVVKKILENHYRPRSTLSGYDKFDALPALHDHVRNEVEYRSRESYTRRFRDPHQIYRHGGNCEGQSLLLAALINSVTKLQARTLAIQSPDADVDHMIVEAGPKRSTFDYTAEQLYEFYKANGIKPAETLRFHASQTDIEPWFIVDPTRSNYIGDTKHLEGRGFITTNRDGSYDYWHIRDLISPD